MIRRWWRRRFGVRMTEAQLEAHAVALMARVGSPGVSTPADELREYARMLADGGHPDTCPSRTPRPLYARNWTPPACPGCVSDTDRAIWSTIAAELEAYRALTQACTDLIDQAVLAPADTPLEFM